MRRFPTKLVALVLAYLTAVQPPNCRAAGVAETMVPISSQVLDVRLAHDGTLRGRVVNSQGAAMKGAAVKIRYENHDVTKTVADENGQFALTGLRGGVHEVVAGQGAVVYRLWTTNAAPPNAQPGNVVIYGESVVRGQGAVARAGIVGEVAAIGLFTGAVIILREHWRSERRTGVVSPFEFPDL